MSINPAELNQRTAGNSPGGSEGYRGEAGTLLLGDGRGRPARSGVCGRGWEVGQGPSGQPPAERGQDRSLVHCVLTAWGWGPQSRSCQRRHRPDPQSPALLRTEKDLHVFECPPSRMKRQAPSSKATCSSSPSPWRAEQQLELKSEDRFCELSSHKIASTSPRSPDTSGVTKCRRGTTPLSLSTRPNRVFQEAVPPEQTPLPPPCWIQTPGPPGHTDSGPWG